jgi:hypothetical protein
VRGQHPYQGPAASDVPILVAFIVLNFSVTVAVRRRATAGARGRSRLRPAEITIMTLAWSPAGSWAVAAAGLCAVLLGHATITARRRG